MSMFYLSVCTALRETVWPVGPTRGCRSGALTIIAASSATENVSGSAICRGGGGLLIVNVPVFAIVPPACRCARRDRASYRPLCAPRSRCFALVLAVSAALTASSAGIIHEIQHLTHTPRSQHRRPCARPWS